MNDPERRKILIIDDEPTLAKAIRRMLADFEVSVADGARAALANIEAGERYDVILTDVMMPEISGIELHNELTRVAPEQAQKMIFMTGGAFTTTARAFFETISNPTIEKPFDRTALFAVLEDFWR